MTSSGHPHRRAHRALATALLAALTLAGCSTAPAESASTKDENAHALLDAESGEIVLPLTEFDLLDSWANQQLINRAYSIDLGSCMNAAGFSYSAAGIEDAPESNIGDRTYGLWDTDRARIYGYGSAPAASQTAFDADASSGGAGRDAAYQECAASPGAELEAFTPGNDEQATSIVARLRTDAYIAASSDPAWQAAREKWWDCVREAGLTPRTGANEWSSQQAADILAQYGPDNASPNKEEEIRVAYLEAQCNSDTRLSQTLGDLEAAYQQPLIDANEAALAEVKTRNQERLAAVRDYIARHG